MQKVGKLHVYTVPLYTPRPSVANAGAEAAAVYQRLQVIVNAGRWTAQLLMECVHLKSNGRITVVWYHWVLDTEPGVARER